jgi:glucose-6-phosphate dehydrogenase assembly protein OpcA
VAPDLIEAGGVWSARDTTPAAVEAALRKLLAEQQHQGENPHAPARVLNLVAIVDREWKGEISNRLESVGRYHPSRTVICAVEPGRTTLDAWASMACDISSEPGALALCIEQVEIDIGPKHLDGLVSIVDPLVVSDLITVVWAPHGHYEAVRSLLGLAEVVLVDSVQEPEARAALDKAAGLAELAYVVDLAWLRSTPWRERIAATFDPPTWRPELAELSSVTVRHREGSEVSAALVLGWLASRLGWAAGALAPENGHLRSLARADGRDVELMLEPVAGLDVPGLSGMTVKTASGASVSLDRGPGGLQATRQDAGGAESSWTVLGASRGEAGILGEGIRQALLRDPTYAPALAAARTLLG